MAVQNITLAESKFASQQDETVLETLSRSNISELQRQAIIPTFSRYHTPERKPNNTYLGD